MYRRLRIRLLRTLWAIQRLFRAPVYIQQKRQWCPIGWQPSVLAPVFYGYRDYTVPHVCRVFFPSLDGAPASAPILEGCGRYPLVLFLHGDCNKEPAEHYLKWFELPAQLARAGYIVAVPQVAHGSPWNDSLTPLHGLVTWIRAQWEYRHMLLPSPATGVIGHSYGALLGARLAKEIPVAAYVGLSGVWNDWPSASGAWPVTQLAVPNLSTWGTGTDDLQEIHAVIGDAQWAGFPLPRHKATLTRGQHWDYLIGGRTACEAGVRGPCRWTHVYIMDLVCLFAGKYLPPESWPNLGNQIADSLDPPAYGLTTEQRFFAGGHLLGMSLMEDEPGCSVVVSWANVAGEADTVVRPC